MRLAMRWNRSAAASATSVQLSPQEAYVRRLQHEMAREANLLSRSSGSDPQRRVTIYSNQ